jgi:Mn-containing catalase
VQDTLTFLMTREVAHYQQFTAALNELPVNFPPGELPGDERFQNVAFNMSNGDGDVRGPWNEGQGPWPDGMEWTYIKNPAQQWLGTDARRNLGEQRSPGGTPNVESDKPFTHEQRIPMS